MKHRLQRGILVAIEGIDGVGKTTQSLRLVDRLKALGFDAIRFFEPTKETPEAKLINQKLQQSNSRASGELTDLFLADRRYDVENYIAPALSEKKIVVMDRYFLSTAAYQADSRPVSYTHLRAHETGRNLVCRLLLEKKKKYQRYEYTIT